MPRYCTNCGKAIENDGKFCTNCGAPAPVDQPTYTQPEPEPQYARQETPKGPKPASYLALSILATIFCCLPFGIVAIVFSAKVDSHWNAGRFLEAQEASRKAKTWMLVSVILGAVAIISYLALVFFGMSLLEGEEFLDILENYR